MRERNRGGAATPVPEPSQPLQFSTLSRIDTPTGGIESEILVAQTASREEVVELLEYIRHVAVPDGRLRIRVFDSREVWESNRRCVMAWKGWPPDRGGTAPECEQPHQSPSGSTSFVGSLTRYPATGFDEILWSGPAAP